MKRYSDYYARPIDGSAAYDYDYLETYEENFYDLETSSNQLAGDEVFSPESPQKTLRPPRAAARAAARHKPVVAPVAVCGFLFSAVLLVVSLLSQIQLTTMTDSNAALQKKITEAQLVNNRLQVEHEIAFNFTEIEKFAVSELGMQKPMDGQIFYLYGSSPDKTEILSRENDSLIDRISDAIASVADILK